MKNLFFVKFLFALMVLGCSNSNQNDNLSTYQNNLDAQFSRQENIEIKLSLYPSTDISNLNLPLNFNHLKLKKELVINGKITCADKTYSTKGYFKSNNFKIDATNENIIENFSGILTLNNKELIFYSGSITINIENKNYEGVFNIANGTGKFESCHSNLDIKGIIDFDSGYKTIIAAGNISLNNNY